MVTQADNTRCMRHRHKDTPLSPGTHLAGGAHGLDGTFLKTLGHAVGSAHSVPGRAAEGGDLGTGLLL